MAANLEKMAESLIAGKIDEVEKLTREALDDGISAEDILNNGLLAGMGVVGTRFKAAEMFIPEVLRSAKAMRGSMELLRPILIDTNVKSVGTFIIGTVEGDLHDIGKNLVGMMFEGAGYEVVNLGIDLPVSAFVDAVKKHKPDLLGLSALLTTTMPRMKEVIDALVAEGLRDKVKIIVGGAPVTQEYADKIGADAYGANSIIAVDTAKEIMNK